MSPVVSKHVIKHIIKQTYDIIVVGAGHAGCEAALAAARLGCKTLLLTLNLDTIALTPCNPSIGGVAKGQVVREIDALGGEMARNTDATMIQIRMLNSSKGPAVRSLRAQVDKHQYMARMKSAVEQQQGLNVKQREVRSLLVQKVKGLAAAKVRGVETTLGEQFIAKAVVVTTGTSLRSRTIVGLQTFDEGRSGEPPARYMSTSLKELGFALKRWKTGTPPRIDSRTVDWSEVEVQYGHDVPLAFAHMYDDQDKKRGGLVGCQQDYVRGSVWWLFLKRNYPYALRGWMPQVPCFLVRTNERTHAAVRRNLDRAPLYAGIIEGVGPRYCPSFEGKVVSFADKSSHQFFLEPEGWDTNEVYVQGANTSLPLDVQLKFLRTIRGLEQVEIVRAGYAIEYDGVATSEIFPSLETKKVRGLFLAGQINGTSGYEEAAGQGIMAGINAVRSIRREEPIILKRSEAYIGVMIDDLVNKDIMEPYRLMTARAEYRLLLRDDNADLRLSELGHTIGLVHDARYKNFVHYRKMLEQTTVEFKKTTLKPTRALNTRLGRTNASLKLSEAVSCYNFLKRPQASAALLAKLDKGKRGAIAPRPKLVEKVEEQIEIQAKYEGYFARQQETVERMQEMEDRRIPPRMDYARVRGLRNEARDRLAKIRPLTLGQAGRLAGVNPADIAVLMVWLKKIAK
jgi:tRNA uridine 5-carboxymethylaminomethyl modification enzyme